MTIYAYKNVQLRYHSQDLVDSSISWNHRAISTKIQWNAPGTAFMLNVDVALYIDIQVKHSNEIFCKTPFWFFTRTFKTDAEGESSCDFTTCEATSTATAVEAFAASNEVILQHILSFVLSSYVFWHICHCVFRKGVDTCLRRGVYKNVGPWIYRALWSRRCLKVLYSHILYHITHILFPIFNIGNIFNFWFSTIYSTFIRPLFT